jgi:hypothetical protein
VDESPIRGCFNGHAGAIGRSRRGVPMEGLTERIRRLAAGGGSALGTLFEAACAEFVDAARQALTETKTGRC